MMKINFAIIPKVLTNFSFILWEFINSPKFYLSPLKEMEKVPMS